MSKKKQAVSVAPELEPNNVPIEPVLWRLDIQAPTAVRRGLFLSDVRFLSRLWYEARDLASSFLGCGVGDVPPLVVDESPHKQARVIKKFPATCSLFVSTEDNKSFMLLVEESAGDPTEPPPAAPGAVQVESSEEDDEHPLLAFITK